MSMDSYVGKICPYCKSEFKEGDDIVQCNQCDAVLHRECWEANRGCTTFDCQGSPAGTWHINEGNREGPTVNTVVQVEKDLDSSLDKFGSKSQTGFKPQLRNDKLENMTQPEPQAHPQPAPQPMPQPVVVAQPEPQPQKQPQQATRICYSCGAVVAADKAFCTVCGNEMDKAQPKPTVVQNQYKQPQPQHQQNTFVNQNQGNSQPQFYQPQQTTYRQPQQNTQFAGDTGILDLVEKNLEYYGPKFSELNQKDSKTSWNWAAALLGAYWLFYRKMYIHGAAYLGISLIISFMGTFGSFLSLALAVALGIFGNWLYMDHLGKVIEKAKAEPSQAETLLARHRGASYTVAIVAAVAWFIFLSIL